MEAFGRLLDILDELRVKCPWDRKQTNESLRPNTIEETMELADAIMGEDDAKMRKDICDSLAFLGVKIDDEANKKRGEEVMISTPDSKVKVCVIPMNEELAICRETVALVK